MDRWDEWGLPPSYTDSRSFVEVDIQEERKEEWLRLVEYERRSEEEEYNMHDYSQEETIPMILDL